MNSQTPSNTLYLSQLSFIDCSIALLKLAKIETFIDVYLEFPSLKFALPSHGSEVSGTMFYTGIVWLSFILFVVFDEILTILYLDG